MKFYSYDYLQSKLQQNNLISYIIIAVLIVILCITLIKYYKNRQDTKYRELSIILVLSTLLAVGVSVNEYKLNAVSSNQYKSSIHFIEKISNDLNIDKIHIYINSEVSIENSFVKVDNTYYRVISSGKKDEYLLEKIELIDPVIEKVEVNK